MRERARFRDGVRSLPSHEHGAPPLTPSAHTPAENGRDPEKPWRIPLDRETWRRWSAAILSFARSEVRGRAALLALTLLGLLVAINGLNVVNSYVGRDFMTAIEARSASRFATMAMLYVGVFGASTIAAVLHRFAEERLGLLWREWLTRRLVERYLHDGTYYWLREDVALQNPDQRIAEDVRTFTTMTLSLGLVLLNTTFTIVAFSGVMWTISPVLFATALGYAALGSVATVALGRPLIGLNYTQADREASLRAELVHLRENAESVALLRREGRLGERIVGRLSDLVANGRRIIAVNRNLGFFTTGYNYLIQIIPVLIVAPLFIRGEAEFGVISQSSMAFSHLLGAFSLVITQFQQISSYAVVLARLGALGESVDQLAERSASGITYEDGGEALRWEGVVLRSPRDGALLIDELTASLEAGTRLLVTGGEEAARIALFRATAGLWNGGEGRILRPRSDAILFVPERPYLPPGTLRQALLRTEREAPPTDEELRAVLRELGVEEGIVTAGGLDVEHDWDDLLSLGEQLQLVLARVVLARPRFVLLDRPGTLLPPEAVTRALDLFAARDVTAVTFAPDATHATRHDAQLELAAEGRWQWRSVREGGSPA